MQADREADRQTGTQAGRQADRQTSDRLTDLYRQTGRQAGRQAGRQTDIRQNNKGSDFGVVLMKRGHAGRSCLFLAFLLFTHCCYEYWVFFGPQTFARAAPSGPPRHYRAIRACASVSLREIFV